MRPEGYTELIGDILITCVGGPAQSAGADVATADVTVSLSPFVPINSRMIGPNGASEIMLVIDEPGGGIATGATGGYGPQAPQILCTTAQQTTPPFQACQTVVGLDNSGQYQVAVKPGTSTPAPNVYQGKIGDFGANSVTFYRVPVLPPALLGVSRVFRITNIRVPVASLTGTLQAILSTSSNQTLPLSGSPIVVGVVGPASTFSVNASPAGGNPSICTPQTTPRLAAKLVFTEGFATAFKTRVVPGGAANDTPNPPAGSNPNSLYAAEAPNLAAPYNQNIPGGLYGSFFSNSESGFIVAAGNYTDTNSGISYTAGLTDYGTRLKAVFTNIPAGLTLYVSTANAAAYPVPGGTSLAPYAVLVSASQAHEGDADEAAFPPLTSAITGSDGLNAYRLPLDSGIAVAAWEVVNANPNAQNVLIFSVYVAYDSPIAPVQPTDVFLSFAPEPDDGLFRLANDTAGLSFPSPRFQVIKTQEGPWLPLNACSLSVSTAPVSFAYSVGGVAPSAQATR